MRWNTQAGVESKYLSWAETTGQGEGYRHGPEVQGGQGGQGGRHQVDQLQQQQPAVASPGPELVLAWVDNTFHNLRQRKVVIFHTQEHNLYWPYVSYIEN